MNRKKGTKKPRPANDRGEWRPIYEVLVDGRDWQQLSTEARLVWFVLKLRCRAAGIRLIPALRHALVAWTGMPFERVEEALLELAGTGRPFEGPSKGGTAPRDTEKHPWVSYEGDIIWVRGAWISSRLSPSTAPTSVKG